MGQHVVRPLGGVGQIAHRRMVGRRHQALEEGQKVGPHVWVGVFLDQERTGGMADEDRQHPVTRGMPRDVAGYLVKPGPAGRNGQHVHIGHSKMLPSPKTRPLPDGEARGAETRRGYPQRRSPCSSITCFALSMATLSAVSRSSSTSARTRVCVFVSPPTSLSIRAERRKRLPSGIGVGVIRKPLWSTGSGSVLRPPEPPPKSFEKRDMAEGSRKCFVRTLAALPPRVKPAGPEFASTGPIAVAPASERGAPMARRAWRDRGCRPDGRACPPRASSASPRYAAPARRARGRA